MAEKFYTLGGITVGTNFQIGAEAPIDARFVVASRQGLDDNDLKKYEGLISYVKDEKKYYRFENGEWKVLSVNTPEELNILIKNLIASETTGAMEFKGAVASLPENPNKGDMYKVSGEFAIGEQTAKVGDTIIYNGEEWFIIPSGDDIEDTWRPVKVGENTLDQTETLEFIAGNNVTITEDAGKITISSSYEDTHYESKLVVGNELADTSNENVGENGNVHLNLVEDGVVRSSHKIVGAGGITVTHAKAEGEDGVNVITIEAPEGAKYDLAAKTENGEAILSLAGTDNTEDKVAVVGDDAVAVTVVDGKIKIAAHDTKYTGSEGTEIKVSAIDDGAISAELISVGYDKLAQDVKDAFASSAENGAKAIADQNKLDIEEITKDGGIIDTKIAAIDFDPYLVEDDITTGKTKGTIKVRNTEVTVSGLGTAAFTDAEAYAPADIDTGVHSVKLEPGSKEGTLKLTVDGAGDEVAVTGLESAAYVTVESLNATAKGYADDVEAKIPTKLGVMSVEGDSESGIVVEGTENITVKIAANTYDAYGAAAAVEAKLPTKADYGVLEVKGDSDSGVVVDNTDPQKPIVKIAENTYDTYGAAAKALEDAKQYADEKPHENTSHTHSAGVGLIKNGDGGISGNVEYSANIDVKYENSKIYLVDKTSGDTIGNGFDASVFVKDSYLQSVSYDDTTNVLTFVFVDNEDKLEAIPVDLNDLVDVYTADEVSLTKSGAQFSIKDGGVSTAKIADDAVTVDKLADAINTDIAKGVEAHGWGNHANAGYLHSSEYVANSSSAAGYVAATGGADNAGKVWKVGEDGEPGWAVEDLSANGWTFDNRDGGLIKWGTEEETVDVYTKINPNFIEAYAGYGEGTAINGDEIKIYAEGWAATSYQNGVIKYTTDLEGSSEATHALTLPEKSGTLAVTDDIKALSETEDGYVSKDWYDSLYSYVNDWHINGTTLTSENVYTNDEYHISINPEEIRLDDDGTSETKMSAGCLEVATSEGTTSYQAGKITHNSNQYALPQASGEIMLAGQEDIIYVLNCN